MRTKTQSTSPVLNAIMSKLNSAYPKAVSYIDLWDYALNGVPASTKLNKRGGTYLKLLVARGQAKQITRGFYTAIPQ